MVAFINKHGIEPVVDQICKLEDAPEAYRRMAVGEQMGKLVVLNR